MSSELDPDRKRKPTIDVPFRTPITVADADALQTMVGKSFLGLDGQTLGEVVGVEAGVARIRIDDVKAYQRDLEATKSATN